MATKARQQYFADEISLQKQRREFSLEDNIKQKIDSVETGAQVNTIETVKVNGTALTPDANKAVNVPVPNVIDNLYSTSTNDALSAKQGKVLYDYLQNIASRGRFLSNWNSATGLPVTNPTESPYPYKAGDYYSISNVATGGGTNYRPDGSSYTIGQASTTVETEEVNVSDFYLYDGTNWLLLVNTARQIAVDSSLSTTSTNPVENRIITNALNGKHPGEISNAAPSNPTEGMLWYDTTNDELKVYDGSQRNVAGGATYTAGKGIAILNGTDYSAMRGPCDEGYHVPNETELTALITALTTLGLTLVDTTAQTYLLMPLAGMRARNDGSVSAQGTEGHYRSCDSASLNRAKRLQIDSYDIAVGGTPIAIGASIRPFKDEAVIPDSGRTTLYAGTGDAGIFHNSTDGIISISADGTTWMTIADKNLGATTVYNYGDTESQANCGYYYQWGNNYGFAWTGAVTTSSTQVDASSYGPSEYSSSTFVTDSPRDYPRNHDLWGGVTGTTQNNNAITNLGVLVSDQANNIFTPGMKIWGGTQSDYQSLTPESNTAYLLLADQPTPPSPGRQPGVNTIAYYPLDSTNTVNDLSGNNYTLTNSNVTFGTNAGVDCASFSSASTRLEGAITTIPTGASARTFSWWFYLNGYSNSWGNIFMKYGTDNTRQNWYPFIENSANHYFGLGMYDDISTTTPCSTGTWYNFICVYDGTDCILYVNGQQIASGAKVLDTQLSNLTIGGAGSDYINGYMSQLIIEDVAWTGTEVSDYYDQTKGNYGIS